MDHTSGCVSGRENDGIVGIESAAAFHSTMFAHPVIVDGT
jgi:hypothetical protein